MAKKYRKENKKTKWLVAGSILVFTLILFSNSINHDILYGWDDGEYITDPTIQQMDIAKMFDSYYLGMYQPLAALSFSINYQSAGENPAPYHATNLLLHLVNVLLVFLLFHRFSKRLDVATIVSLLFAIHPMHVEAVSWIATRSNLIYSMFYLGALISYLVYLQKKNFWFIILTFLLFMLSCFAKSMSVTLPVLLFLFDWYFNRKFNTKAILEKIPFFIVSIIFGLVSINAASTFGHIRNLDVEYNLLDRAVLIIYSIVFYIVKAIVPFNLSAVYAYPDKDGVFLPWHYYFAVLVFAFLLFNVIRSGKFKKEVWFGSLFFLITISVVLPLVWSRMLMLADRYTYIPYIGLFFIMAAFFRHIYESKNTTIRKYKTAIYSILIMYLIFLAIATFQRNTVWKDAETMITDVIDKDRSNVDVSIGYFFRGNIRDIEQDPQGALSDFSKAIELNPDYTMAYNNRGIIKGSLQDYEGALEDFSKAIELEPDYADAIYNRGNAHYYLKQFNEACSDWSLAAYLGSEQAVVIKKKYCK